VPRTVRKSLGHWAAILAFCAYMATCIVTFYTLVQPSFNHQSEVHLDADAGTYLAVADFVRDGGAGVALVSLGGNLLGPVLIALLCKTGIMITLFNMLLFCIAIYAAGVTRGIDRWLFAVLVMLNAETLVSLVTVNKEILALFSATLFAKYIYSEQRSKLLLLVILVSALFARWQQLGIVLLYFLLRRQGSFFEKRPKLALTLIVLLLAVAYPFMSSEYDLSGFTAQGETGGTMTVMNHMQAHFLYPLVVLPKIVMNLAGQLITPSFFWTTYLTRPFSDLQNQFAVQLHTVAMVGLWFAAWAKGRLRLQEPLIFFSGLYLVVTALTPFVQPRYQYPVYVLLCLELARKRESVPAYSAGPASPDSPRPGLRMPGYGLAEVTARR